MLAYPMFSNLLQNAFDASPKGSRIEIDLEAHETFATFSITNPGVVPEEIRERFFEKYVTAGKQGGTGLGTYSAKLCAETQGGSIKMETLPDQRTRITITLQVMKRLTMEELKAQILGISAQ